MKDRPQHVRVVAALRSIELYSDIKLVMLLKTTRTLTHLLRVSWVHLWTSESLLEAKGTCSRLHHEGPDGSERYAER